jgi:hypothetical protein
LSSSRVKLSLSKPRMGLPFLSLTTTLTCTRRVVTCSEIAGLLLSGAGAGYWACGVAGDAIAARQARHVANRAKRSVLRINNG